MRRNILKYAFVILVAWPVTRIWLGLNVRHRDRLPRQGPAIMAANHNSHLDTLALLSLFPLSLIRMVRPVAAADYFMRSRVMGWLSQNVFDIVPVDRTGHKDNSDPLEACYAALDHGDILIIFPEGTRGEPEHMTELKSGVARLAERYTEVPVVPVFIYGLGKSMPKGALIPVPIFVDIFLGIPFYWMGSRDSFMTKLQEMFNRLGAKRHALDDI